MTFIHTDPLKSLLQTYNDLNSASITILDEIPSPLEFMRFVALNRPFAVRGGAADWKASREWGVKKLKEVMSGMRVNVAVTPKGNADSPARGPNGDLLFVKPHEEEQDFTTFLDFIITQEKNGRLPNQEIRYAQTQNDNLRNEYSPLYPSVPPTIPFSRIALAHSPEAINLWIGNSHSVTALHKDNYENIYVQILGQKHFVLMPPLAYPCVKERVLRSANYVRDGKGGLEIKEEEGRDVPFATWDPDVEEEGVGEEEREMRELVRPMRVTLEAGDMLYLPALWYHKVSQSCNEEGICCAVNYWHDMEFSGSFYPLCNLVRNLTLEKERGKIADKIAEQQKL
ncbi:cupin-like domain-containing protein [Amylocarpus encephaloides]|uniref:Cupin-like domain-containing protein n=1 Tax=Amylocarpus encephaloides TaxID=45428 RepID=A0A9P8C7C5_9HELO|nr:cupin-like domain-containing protein [Amylocarpus encephaloides]